MLKKKDWIRVKHRMTSNVKGLVTLYARNNNIKTFSVVLSMGNASRIRRFDVPGY